MKYFSMFSGIGGFELGIQRAFSSTQGEGNSTETSSGDTQRQGKQLPELGVEGLSCIGYSEIDKYAIKVYERRFNGHTNYGDATKINAKELPDFDLLVGGFPCQAFSVAGKRKGFNDTRGTLFFDIARILSEKRPRHLVLENVKGLLSHDKGKTFQTILGVLSDLGYRVEWQVLNSKDFGVPQNRERIFIVGHLRGECGSKVFPITGSTTEDIGDFVDLTIGNPSKLTKQSRALQARYFKGYSKRTAETSGVVQLTETRTEEAKKIRRESQKQGKDWSPRRGKKLVPRNDNKANTVPTSSTKEQLLLENARIRRLTPKETERLQGFPDDWTAEGIDGAISDTQRYKMCGNAVTVNVVEAVMRELFNHSNIRKLFEVEG